MKLTHRKEIGGQNDGHWRKLIHCRTYKNIHQNEQKRAWWFLCVLVPTWISTAILTLHIAQSHLEYIIPNSITCIQSGKICLSYGFQAWSFPYTGIHALTMIIDFPQTSTRQSTPASCTKPPTMSWFWLNIVYYSAVSYNFQWESSHYQITWCLDNSAIFNDKELIAES